MRSEKVEELHHFVLLMSFCLYFLYSILCFMGTSLDTRPPYLRFVPSHCEWGEEDVCNRRMASHQNVRQNRTPGFGSKKARPSCARERVTCVRDFRACLATDRRPWISLWLDLYFLNFRAAAVVEGRTNAAPTRLPLSSAIGSDQRVEEKGSPATVDHVCTAVDLPVLLPARGDRTRLIASSG